MRRPPIPIFDPKATFGIDRLSLRPGHWHKPEFSATIPDTGMMLGLKPAQRGDWGGEPLHHAAGDGDLAEVKRLIDQDADVNAREDGGGSPLHFAAGNGFVAIVELLIARGAEVNAITDEGVTPLDVAISQDHENVAHLLRLYGRV